MTDKPKRPWFQFSLSTAIMMMLITGAIVPPLFILCLKLVRFLSIDNGYTLSILATVPIIVIIVILLVAVAFISESIIRRRSARKP